MINETGLDHNLICLGTAEGSSFDGFVYGLPHYLEIFNASSINETEKLDVWGQALVSTSGTISYMFSPSKKYDDYL